MANIINVKKSRKEKVCGNCNQIIPVGSEYSWIAFNFGPTIVRCKTCGIKSYETTANPYSKELGKIVYAFEQELNTCVDISGLETVRDNIVSELESLAEDLQGRKDNLPDQLQESGPGEVITTRIDNLEEVISDLENLDFSFDDYSDTEDYDEILKILDESGKLEEEWNEGEVREKFIEHCEELLEEKMDELRDELESFVSTLEY